jgi:hypothetical protein
MPADRFVDSDEIRSALAGRETELLDALGIPWRKGNPHISCPIATTATTIRRGAGMSARGGQFAPAAPTRS